MSEWEEFRKHEFTCIICGAYSDIRIHSHIRVGHSLYSKTLLVPVSAAPPETPKGGA